MPRPLLTCPRPRDAPHLVPQGRNAGPETTGAQRPFSARDDDDQADDAATAERVQPLHEVEADLSEGVRAVAVRSSLCTNGRVDGVAIPLCSHHGFAFLCKPSSYLYVLLLTDLLLSHPPRAVYKNILLVA